MMRTMATVPVPLSQRVLCHQLKDACCARLYGRTKFENKHKGKEPVEESEDEAEDDDEEDDEEYEEEEDDE
jgi:hypothetical protein